MRLGWPLKIFFALLVVVISTWVFLNTALREQPVTGSRSPVAAPAGGRTEVFVTTPGSGWAETLLLYENWIRQQLKNRKAPGIAIAIVQDTSVLYMKGLGYRHVARGDTIDTHTVFRLGSVSKSITGTLAAHLVQQQVLHWDDPVIRFFPGFRLQSPVQTSQTTIRHVLSHTMGLPYHAFTDRVDAGAPIDTLIYHLRDLPLVAKAGKVYSYQNVAFNIFAKVTESIFHQSYEDVLKTRLFEPLAMWDASASHNGIIHHPNHAVPHRLIFRSWIPTRISTTYYNVEAAGGINASISDMARWLKTLTSDTHNFIDPEHQAEMFEPYVRATARNRHFGKWKRPQRSFYGMGWRVLTFPGDTLYYHGGYVNGFRSEVAYHPAERIGIAVLVNAPGALADHALPEFFYTYEKQRSRQARLKSK